MLKGPLLFKVKINIRNINGSIFLLSISVTGHISINCLMGTCSVVKQFPLMLSFLFTYSLWICRAKTRNIRNWKGREGKRPWVHEANQGNNGTKMNVLLWGTTKPPQPHNNADQLHQLLNLGHRHWNTNVVILSRWVISRSKLYHSSMSWIWWHLAKCDWNLHVDE